METIQWITDETSTQDQSSDIKFPFLYEDSIEGRNKIVNDLNAMGVT